MSGMAIRIGGSLVSVQDVRAWEFRRAGAVLATLQRKLGIDQRDMASPTLEGRRVQIAAIRQLLDREGVRKLWRHELTLSAATSRIATFFSGHRRHIARTDIFVPDIDVAYLATELDALMLQDTLASDAVNLAACPDHHLFEPHGKVLEVVETTGGAPFPTRFFLAYGDESGLTLPRDPTFSHQSAGTARLANGDVVGGIRHQFKTEGTGVHAALAVEFPAALPGYMVRSHEWHLACEFCNWFEAIALHKVSKSEVRS